MNPAVEQLKLRDFRILADAELRFEPGWNFFCGSNAQGKTSLLEAIIVLLRLQSPRTRRLADLIRFEGRGLVLDGWVGKRHLQFYYSAARKKLALDGVEQKTASEYLSCAGVVLFANEDIQLVRGGAEGRRRFLDFLAAQSIPGYRISLRAYERALRSRNRLLKQPGNPWRQIAAYDGPLVDAGNTLLRARRECVEKLADLFRNAANTISPDDPQTASLAYAPGVSGDFQSALDAKRDEEQLAGQTLVGPHRDDLALAVGGKSASAFASEGQQRTLALALKAAEATLISQQQDREPILLLDDVFGELDTTRRAALLKALPQEGQRFVTSTGFDWLEEQLPGPCWRVEQGRISPQSI